ncbi:CidA/LrgA family protein [Lactobacillus sp. ESL0701]|uniref:CidA/LrgA family protein n=1 Tax=Lactobacillus sp. ESL0701 TaxID=2983217 RepID=UPI0023F98C74|nr:CidA/LrgA family protein [Lactobacillus sp. ESL0701]MDF7671865.1 CidA/LrgA family protein [Lactobacillus sp. ESL0701]
MDKNKESEHKSAPLLFQMLVYAAILFASQLISEVMPKNFPVPTPVIGLVLLYVLLTTHVVKLEWVDSFGSALISLISFMFVPSGISIAGNLDIMKAQGVQLVIVILLATIILLVVTAYTTRALLWVKKKLTSVKLGSTSEDVKTGDGK